MRRRERRKRQERLVLPLSQHSRLLLQRHKSISLRSQMQKITSLNAQHISLTQLPTLRSVQIRNLTASSQQYKQNQKSSSLNRFSSRHLSLLGLSTSSQYPSLESSQSSSHLRKSMDALSFLLLEERTEL